MITGMRWRIFAALFLFIGVARSELPVGSAPAALKFEHFPTRVHAFVFRNWNLVETERLAKILGTTPEKIRALAGEMGLPHEEAVPGIYRSRLYLSLIRRNWHLLPYEQLLELLETEFKRLTERNRIYSVSMAADSALMWERYGGHHTGYCLEFENEGLFSHARQVEYP